MEGKLGKQSHAEEGKLQGQPNNAFASFTSSGVKREQKSCPRKTTMTGPLCCYSIHWLVESSSRKPDLT